MNLIDVRNADGWVQGESCRHPVQTMLSVQLIAGIAVERALQSDENISPEGWELRTYVVRARGGRPY